MCGREGVGEVIKGEGSKGREEKGGEEEMKGFVKGGIDGSRGKWGSFQFPVNFLPSPVLSFY